jgi:hypothetical protein
MDYVWGPTTVGKIDFLEMFSGSAKLSQSASMQGLRVGAPIDLRTGCDLLRKAMEVIERKQPKIIPFTRHQLVVHGSNVKISANGRYLRYPHPLRPSNYFFIPLYLHINFRN